jgi:PAS domain S-box-containing protein
MNLDSWTGILLDNISVGICIIDKDYKVLFWNEYMEAYTGYSKDEVQNNYLFHFFPAFKDKIYRERIDNIFNGWPPVILSSRLHNAFFKSRTSKGNIRFQEITVTPQANADGEVQHAVFTITDVSDLTTRLDEQKSLYNKAQDEIRIRTEMQEKLTISEKRLRELNSTKDKFFSIIAHDLMSPFNSILGLCEILSQNINDKDYQNIDEYGQAIISSSRKAFALLVNLLEWSRLQTGRISFNPVQISFKTIINDNIELFKNSALQKEVLIETDIKPDLNIYADYNMINTVVRNLLSNAIKYTSKAGNIRISVLQNTEETEFSIKDSGVGIRDDDIDKIFRLDIQFTTPGTANESGSGLGLMLCREFIEKHNGKIWVESKLNKGTTFKFVIPNSVLRKNS